jgi:hypothetical protein
MTRLKSSNCLRCGAAAVVLGLSACGGGDPAGPDPDTGMSLEIAPGSVLLTPGRSQSIAVYEVDVAGRKTAVTATLESSNRAVVSVSGMELTGGATGSATIVAHANGLTSAPVLAYAARPAEGAVLVSDEQVIGDPEAVSPPDTYGPGWRYQVTLRGVSVAAGQILLSTGGARVAGRVVSVAPAGSDALVTLELRPLRELFSELSVEATLPMAEGRAVTPAVGVRPSNVRTAVNQVDTEFELGSFECKASAGASASNFTVDFGTPVVTPDVSLEFALDAEHGLRRLVVVGTVTATELVKPRFTGSVTGSVDCHGIIHTLVFPVGGVLSFFVAGKFPIGAGFTLGAEATSATLGADLELHGQATAKVGIDCAVLCVPVLDFATSSAGTTLKPVLPPLDAAFRAKFSGSAYIYTEFGIGNPIVESFYIDLIAAKGGVTQSFDLASREFQAADATYASNFELRPFVTIGTTARIGEAAGVLGFELPPLEVSPEFEPLAHSPAGTLQITPAQVRAGSGTSVGQQATFTVTMDGVSYLGAYALEAIELRWKKTGTAGAVTLEPGRPGCTDLAAAADQRVFSCRTDFPAEDVGTQTFYAFAKTRIFGVPIFAPLEIAVNAVASVTVGDIAVSPATVTLAAGAQQTFTASGAASGVTWTASGGTYTTTGTTLTYTAGSAAGTFAVTARSVADPTQSATASVTITAAPPPPPSGNATVTVIRDSILIMEGDRSFFSAVVEGGIFDPSISFANAVTWSATGGAITQTSPTSGGLYTAGTIPGTFTVTATSLNPAGFTGTAKVVIVAPVSGGYSGTSCTFLSADSTSCTVQPATASVGAPFGYNGAVYVGFATAGSNCAYLARLVSGSGSGSLVGTEAYTCSGLNGITGNINAEGSWGGSFTGTLLTGHLAIAYANRGPTYSLEKQ